MIRTHTHFCIMNQNPTHVTKRATCLSSRARRCTPAHNTARLIRVAVGRAVSVAFASALLADSFQVSTSRGGHQSVVSRHSLRLDTAVTATSTSTSTGRGGSLFSRFSFKTGASRNERCCVSRCATTAEASLASAAVQDIVVDLRKRILDAPESLPDDREAEQSADDLLNRFEIGGDGAIVGGDEKELRLAETVARETVVVVRLMGTEAVASLQKLGAAAEELLGGGRTAEERGAAFGTMKDYGEGMVAGYAGGGDYGADQFLETRGDGVGGVVPMVGEAAAVDVIVGRRTLSAITFGVLRAIARHNLPGVDPAAFLQLVDSGEGETQKAGSRSDAVGEKTLSSTPLRICRYAGAGGVAFGAHTDTTFLTVIPCASIPGLEILQPSTGRWLRPEAASDVQAGADVMLLAGELLQVLGGGRYPAAVHRVVRPAGLADPRVSTPLLARGNARAIVDESMLSSLAAASFNAIETAVLPASGAVCAMAGNAPRRQVSMRDLWAALQFHAEPSDETPLARSRLGREQEVRQSYEPFAPAGLSVLSLDPLLVRLNGFASRADCGKIIDQASGTMEESRTWGSADAQDESSGVRKSSTTWVADAALPLLKGLTERVTALSGLPSTFMEKWQVARYKPKGYFNLHTDHVEAFNRLCCGGRLGTLILYLNDDFEGGHTEFPTLGVSVQPSAGDAIYFHSVEMPVERTDAESMRADERSAHAGLPVDGGDKWIATKWIHPLPYPHGRQGAETREQAARSRELPPQEANS